MGELTQTCPLVSTSCLVQDFLQYKLNQKGYQYAWKNLPKTPRPFSLMKALRKIGDEFETKNRLAFDEMFANLDITPDNAEATFLGVVNELFSEGVTWGRLVAMFAFGGEMAVQSAEKEMTAIVNPLAEWMTAYVDNQLANWINDHGGWESFTEFCQINKDTDEPKPVFKKAVWGLAVGVIGALTVGALLAK